MKTILFKNYRLWSQLFILLGIASALLILRIKVTHDFYLLFLVWNIILAFIPYVISSYLKFTYVTGFWKRIILPIAFCAWLLFLPNAPYIITDLIHISNSSGYWKLYDSLLIGSCAALGTYLGILSIMDMRIVLQQNFSKTFSRLIFKIFPYAIIFLCSFGIYLGRTLRYNSWDILQRPLRLWDDSWKIISSPFENAIEWLFIASMTIVLIGIFHLINTSQNEN